MSGIQKAADSVKTTTVTSDKKATPKKGVKRATPDDVSIESPTVSSNTTAEPATKRVKSITSPSVKSETAKKQTNARSSKVLKIDDKKPLTGIRMLI
jgi:hypothetical protein